MLIFSGGHLPWLGGQPDIPEKFLKEKLAEIKSLESVITFKEIFPEYREYDDAQYNIQYTVQARNSLTGNVLSLQVFWDFYGMPSNTEKGHMREMLRCIPGQGIVGSGNDIRHFDFRDEVDLFLHETIKNTDCLDDDYKPIVISQDLEL